MDYVAPMKMTDCLKVVTFCLALHASGITSNNCDFSWKNFPTREVDCSAPRKSSVRLDPLCRLSNQQFPDIPKSCQPNISYIYMFSCCLNYLDEEILALYKEIECIDLPYNQISVLPHDVFLNNEHLKKIYITNNNLRIVEPDAFAGLPYLDTVDLRHNRLDSLPVSTFSSFELLRVLRLDGNQFNDASISLTFQNASRDFPNLCDLSLSSNKITAWSIGKMINLQSLNLGNNLLQTWSAGKMIPNVKNLDLSGNQISELAAGSFENNHKLMSIDLSNNKIHFLDKNIFQNLCELAILNLSGNFLVSAHPEWFDVVVHNLKSSNERIKNEVGIENNSWKCDCSLLDLKKLLQNVTQLRPRGVFTGSSRDVDIPCWKDNTNTSIKHANINNCPNRDEDINGICRISVQKLLPSYISSSYIYAPFGFSALLMLLLLAACLIAWRRNSRGKFEQESSENDNNDDEIGDSQIIYQPGSTCDYKDFNSCFGQTEKENRVIAITQNYGVPGSLWYPTVLMSFTQIHPHVCCVLCFDASYPAA